MTKKLNWSRAAKESSIARWGKERILYMELEDEEYVPLKKQPDEELSVEVLARRDMVKMVVRDLGICKIGEDQGKHLFEIDLPPTKHPIRRQALYWALRHLLD